MLTKKDLNQIEEITERVVQKSISEAFLDFYEHIFGPFIEKTEQMFEKNDRQHKEIVQKVISIEKDVNTLKSDMEYVKEYIKDHDGRIEHLEAIIRVKN